MRNKYTRVMFYKNFTLSQTVIFEINEEGKGYFVEFPEIIHNSDSGKMRIGVYPDILTKGYCDDEPELLEVAERWFVNDMPQIVPPHVVAFLGSENETTVTKYIDCQVYGLDDVVPF